MSWASRRQFKYATGVIIFLGLIIFAFAYPYIFKKPTCTDNKQNGTETGVDCGGTCSLMCKSDISEPVVLWSRAFHVTGNNYNLVAYVENRNNKSGVVKAPYEFRVYDTNNKLLGRKQGVTFIPPNQQFAIFESRFDSGQNEIKSVVFDFPSPLTWVKKEPTLQTIDINVNKIVFNDDKDTPSLTAVLNNYSIYDIPEFNIVAILYDIDHNAINASKTTTRNKLMSNTSLPLVFTWPETLSAIPVMKDVIVQINPFSVSF
jgi:hypothetical protein